MYLTDTQLLAKLLEDERLGEKEEKAFREMLDRLMRSKRNMPLTPSQRQWAEKVYARLELDAEEGAANLISSGQYTPTKDELQKKYGFELMPKPLKPPGR